MAVYNGERYLREAVDSLLAQTWRDFELIAVDDGSTDLTHEILSGYAAADPRVRVLDMPHSGLPNALNAGWRQGTGEYIARMDADDIALPERLARQVAFLDGRPDIGLCSTGFRTIGARKNYTRTEPVDDANIRCRLLFEATLRHSTLMIRRALLVSAGGYDPAWLQSQDHELYVRLADTTRFASLPEVLLHFRVHEGSVSSLQRGRQRELSRFLFRKLLRRLEIEPNDAELEIHDCLSNLLHEPDRLSLATAEAWLLKLRRANRQLGVYPEPAFSHQLGLRWYSACEAAAGNNPRAFLTFARCTLAYSARLGISDWRRFGLKSAKAITSQLMRG